MDGCSRWINGIHSRTKINGKTKEISISKGASSKNINAKDYCKNVLLNMGYKPSSADPCLFYKDGTTKSFIIIYVDDGGIFSDKDTIKEVIQELGITFNVNYLGNWKNSLDANWLKMNQKIQSGYINQHHLNILNKPLVS
jgi:hypothetical protein